jgi:hypothetical protein
MKGTTGFVITGQQVEVNIKKHLNQASQILFMMKNMDTVERDRYLKLKHD